ncbi:hypothetical protein V6N12_040823 [Hibiscus sabdariffa]|uniref:Reverse transcriptase domain-containing protein n=1 Tax=Hibiscus sabdariffa TaxID=183260 RepID=A0ABR2E4S6_9ROSI
MDDLRPALCKMLEAFFDHMTAKILQCEVNILPFELRKRGALVRIICEHKCGTSDVNSPSTFYLIIVTVKALQAALQNMIAIDILDKIKNSRFNSRFDQRNLLPGF